MTTTVYWAYCEPQWQMAHEPVSISAEFAKKRLWDAEDKRTQLMYCPAVKEPFLNLYGLKSLYDYEFEVIGNRVTSKYNDEAFFKAHVNVRSAEKRFFSFVQNYTFFTDAPSLEVTFGFPPYLEDNNVAQRCMQIPGKMDIGKWFRALDMPFYLRKDYNSFKIEREEIYSYCKFHTDDKIEFKQFRMNDELYKFMDEGFSLNFNRYMRTMENYYKRFKNKKFILREIKENLV
jgi:hypothetical protein